VHCPDQPGIVVAITDFIFRNAGNILFLDQHVDREQQVFFLRVEWDLERFCIESGDIGGEFVGQVAGRFGMRWRLYFSDEVPRMAVFVSKLPHCFHDILARYESGEWRVEIPLIISNHPDLSEATERLGIDFYHLPVIPETRRDQELKQLWCWRVTCRSSGMVLSNSIRKESSIFTILSCRLSRAAAHIIQPTSAG
jgi:formyltetrahydrofolate deformylase